MCRKHLGIYLVGLVQLCVLGVSPAFAQEEIPVPEPMQITDETGQGSIPEVNPQAPAPVAPVYSQPDQRRVVPQQQQYQQPQQQQQSQQPEHQQSVQPHGKKFVAMTNPNKWSAFFTLGTTFGASSTYTLSATDSTSGTSASAAVSSTGDRGNVIFGGEIAYRFIPLFQLGVGFDWTKYQYADTTFNGDSEFGFFVLPRTQVEWDMWTFWFGLGLGLERTGIGSATSSSTTTTTTNAVDSSFSGFAFSPRLGADYEINESLMVGLQLTYTSFKGSLNGVLGVASSSASGIAVDVSRHWFSIALRVGTQW